jgi:hypothetical protein
VERYVVGAAALGLLNAVVVLAVLVLIRNAQHTDFDNTYT